jgi:hypothetical protein
MRAFDTWMQLFSVMQLLSRLLPVRAAWAGSWSRLFWERGTVAKEEIRRGSEEEL